MLPIETIPLAHPVEIDGVTHTSLSLRLPTIDDYAAVRRMNVGSVLRCMKLLARLSGIETKALIKILSANEAANAQCATLVKQWFGY